MRSLLSLAWRDLSASGHTLWIFCICLALGVTLVAATGGLYKQVSDGLLSETRALTGGDLEVEARAPLPQQVLSWMQDNGTVSLLTELDTMMGTQAGDFQMVELQSVDGNYPLYGHLKLQPAVSLDNATALTNETWGIAIDPVLADQLDLAIGDRVDIGALRMQVRALIETQPDRRLSADWRGPPILISGEALAATELVRQGSRVEYEYRVKTNLDPDAWREAFYNRFPDGSWEVQTFTQRSDRIAERLGQVASGLLIIGFSTLFIGGLGVFNSVQAYLQGKLATIATFRAIGLRDRRLAFVYLSQIGILAGVTCLVGAILGFGISLVGAAIAETQARVTTAASSALFPAMMAIAFGLLTAFTFAMPAIGRALSINPAALFRRIDGSTTRTPRAWWIGTITGCVLIALLVFMTLPDPLFALGFIAVVLTLLGLLELIVKGLRRLALWFENNRWLRGDFALRLAVANVHRPGSPLRTSLLSLGSALTLLVVCAIVVGALIDAINKTIPADAPALVLYDIGRDQRTGVIGALEDNGATRTDIAPLVRGRIRAVDDERLTDSQDKERQEEARDEHKLTYRANNIDHVTLVRGGWWSPGPHALAKVAMEDREADQLGVDLGDKLTFEIQGRTLDARLSGIYAQKGMQTRFWFEAILSDGALDPFISRYVGAAYMDDDAALTAQRQIADIAPNVVTVRTATLLATARELLGKAVAGLAVIALISLFVSLLVLTGVMATSRSRQIYDATILHAVGARLSIIKQSLNMEYLLLALVTSAFAITIGSAIAVPLLIYRLKLPPTDYPLWAGVITALGVSTVCLYLGGRYMLRRLHLNPALLLRTGG